MTEEVPAAEPEANVLEPATGDHVFVSATALPPKVDHASNNLGDARSNYRCTYFGNDRKLELMHLLIKWEGRKFYVSQGSYKWYQSPEALLKGIVGNDASTALLVHCFRHPNFLWKD